MTKKVCFFVTPIGDEGSTERKNSDTILKHILTPVCDPLDFTVIRVDLINSVDKIDSTIIKHLRTSDLVVADISLHNPNVFYEFGYRQALNLPLIPIISEGADIPFDVTTLRTITYAINDLDKVESTKNRLIETMQSFNYNPEEKLTIEPKPIDNTMMLSIQDKLDKIIDLVSTRNDEEISKISALVAKHSAPQVSTETALMQAMLPTLMQDPDAITNLMKVADALPKDK